MIVDEEDLSSVIDILHSVSESRISSLRRQAQFFWRAYFSTLRAITLTTLQIINDRVFPYTALKYEDWNDPPSSVSSFLYLERWSHVEPGNYESWAFFFQVDVFCVEWDVNSSTQ